MNNNKIELLAPAGSFDTLKTAVNAGADAIYIGGSMFSARASATNFDNAQITEAIDYSHCRNVKIYVAINTLIKDEELKECIDYISFLNDIGADAIIVQDIGLVHLIRKIFPDLPLHFSTQSTISSTEDINALRNFDIQRVVLPREITIDEISQISKNCNLEIEAFIHGALCVSYSGKCLFSALNGGRSGNRGACAQVCRKKYLLEVDGKVINDKLSEYVLSPKDLNTSNSIDKIIQSGVTSLKIEGRMKRKEYIHVCVKSYRQLLDEYMKYGKISKQNIEDANYNLNRVFNRSFTNGYILNSQGSNIINNSHQKPIGQVIGQVIEYNKKNKKLKIKLNENVQKGDGLDIGENIGRIIKSDGKISDTASKNEIIYLDFIKEIKKGQTIHRTYDYAYEKKLEEEQKIIKKLPISAKIILKLNDTPTMTLKDENIHIVQNIDFKIESSKNSPISDETIIKQISKTDTFPFEIKNLEIEKSENIFIPVKILNELRRKALEKLYSEKINSFKRNHVDYNIDEFLIEKNNNYDKIKSDLSVFVYITSENQLDYIKPYINNIQSIISSDINLYKKIYEFYPDKAVYQLPSIIRQNDFINISNLKDSLNTPRIMFSSYSFMKDKSAYIANYHMNIYNSLSHKYYNSQNIYTVASPENIFANSDEYKYLNDKSKTIIPIYIYPHLMLSEFCPHKDELGKCIYDYKCKLPNTAIINEQGDRFLFEKFLNCKTSIIYEKPYFLNKSQIIKYIEQGYTNFMIELKNENKKSVDTIFSNII